LLCPRCGAELKLLAVLTDPDVVFRIARRIEAGAGDDPFEARAPPDPPAEISCRPSAPHSGPFAAPVRSAGPVHLLLADCPSKPATATRAPHSTPPNNGEPRLARA
jgi:hypothetical protein